AHRMQGTTVVPDGPVQSLMHRRAVGLDVHKDSIVVSLAEVGLRGGLREVREYGKIPNTPAALKAMATKLAAGGNDLRFCYEAGPCGYGVQRQLCAMGQQCALHNYYDPLAGSGGIRKLVAWC